MGKIYSGQTDLTIKLQTNKDLTGVTSTKILYRKPNGVEGEFNATVIDIPKGIIQYVVSSATDFENVGRWTVWAKIVDAGGLVSIGEPSVFNVEKEGY